MLVGYARVSTRKQNHALQLEVLQTAGCDRVYIEKASGAQRDRPELKVALDPPPWHVQPPGARRTRPAS
jgi:DNA invertase Pin-like site-specific DNA recombinase